MEMEINRNIYGRFYQLIGWFMILRTYTSRELQFTMSMSYSEEAVLKCYNEEFFEEFNLALKESSPTLFLPPPP